VAATPVVIDQCQQPTILFSRDGNPSSRFTPLRASLRVTMAHGPRRSRASPGEHACLSRVLSSRAARHEFRARFVAVRVPDRTLALDDRSPPLRWLRPSM